MLLRVKDLSVEFKTSAGNARAVDGVSFNIEEGKTHVLVGESGCGKSVTSLAVIGLLPGNASLQGGQIEFKGKDLTKLSRTEYREYRGSEMGMIFQEPMTALNPVVRVGHQIEEAIRQHRHKSPLKNEDPFKRSVELIDQMGIKEPEKSYYKYPHELSGGMRQRIMIAIALACRPSLLIADEPTTALDVTTQEQILSLMKELQNDLGTAILLITHNLGVVANNADSMSVMYAGQVVEEGPVSEIFQNPCHPYTEALFRAIPSLTSVPGSALHTIPGSVPPAVEFDRMPSPCRFFERCEYQDERCFKKSSVPGHNSYCRRET
ncbi:MAG: ABC transporter ATP-binding protein [Spirochaetia bacterium]|nr:ABC transporter ATP-binding protein [Spirochaetia bacterium]